MGYDAKFIKITSNMFSAKSLIPPKTGGKPPEFNSSPLKNDGSISCKVRLLTCGAWHWRKVQKRILSDPCGMNVSQWSFQELLAVLQISSTVYTKQLWHQAKSLRAASRYSQLPQEDLDFWVNLTAIHVFKRFLQASSQPDTPDGGRFNRKRSHLGNSWFRATCTPYNENIRMLRDARFECFHHSME